MIHVGFICTLGRLRQVDPAQVKALAESIKEVGLLNPITVYRREIIRNGQPADGYGLVAGAHRLEACKSLGWSEVPAVVVDLDDDSRIIAECDENLCGSKLTAAEVAMFTAKRKEAYLRLHPETAAGVAGAQAKHKTCATDNLSFADDQAAKTGKDARSVRRDAERGEKVTPAALAMVKGTALDTGVFLDKLKDIPAAEQTAFVQSALAKPKKPKAAPHAPDPEDDYSVREKQVAALMNAWNKAGKEAREAFLDRIGAAQ
jgi:ParB family chromosome partitioning protein